MAIFFIKIIVSCLCLLLTALPCAAQEKQCSPENSPPLLNLRLGMSPEQTQSILGKALKIKVKKKGQHTFFQNFIEKRPPSALNGVRALYLRFFDRSLYQIEIFYEEDSNAKTNEYFVASLSSQLNFPVSSWQIEKGKATIICGEFSIVADKILNLHIEMTDETIRAKVEELREKSKK